MSIWKKYPNYTERELATLTKAASQVLMAGGGDDVAGIGSLFISPRKAAREVAQLMGSAAPSITPEAVQDLLERAGSSSQLALQILGMLREQPELARLIEAEYVEATKQMTGMETILAAALLVLVCKITRFKLSKEGVEMSFAPFSGKITSLLSVLMPKG